MKENNLEKVEDKKEKVIKKDNNKHKNIETKVVLQRRKPSVFLSILLILIGALISAIIFLVFFGDKIISEEEQVQTQEEKPEENIEEPKEIVKEVRKLNLNEDGDFITLLYSKLTKFNNLLPLVYNSEVTIFESLSDNSKLLFALESSNSSTLSLSQISSKLDNKMNFPGNEMNSYSAKKITIEEASRAYKSIYGQDKEIPLIDADNGIGYVYEYVPEDSCYYGHLYIGGGGTSFSYKTSITSCKANEDATEVYIYEDFIAMNQTKTSSEGNLWTLYSDSAQNSIIKDDILETNSNGNSLFENMNKEEFLSKYLESDGVNYKHTYKLDDAGNYYWYSTEVNQ